MQNTIQPKVSSQNSKSENENHAFDALFVERMREGAHQTDQTQGTQQREEGETGNENHRGEYKRFAAKEESSQEERAPQPAIDERGNESGHEQYRCR